MNTSYRPQAVQSGAHLTHCPPQPKKPKLEFNEKTAKSTNWNGMRVEDRLFTGILRKKAGISNLISTFEVNE